MALGTDAMNDQLEPHRDTLRRMARKLLYCWPTIDPSDIVQNAFVQVLQKPGDYPAPGLLVKLRVIVRSKAIDAIRYEFRRRHSPLPSDGPPGSGPSPSWPLISQDDARRLAKALDQLLPDERDAVELNHLQGWSHSEIAEHLERTRPAVAGLLHRGLKKMQKVLTEPE